MITKHTAVEQIEIKESGIIQVRMEKRIMENGNVIACQYHRTAVEPGSDVEAQMAFVNSHLDKLGEEQVSDSDIARIKAHAETAWTPEIIKAWAEKPKEP